MSNGDYLAFPEGALTHANGQVEWGQSGLTKRELFAAMAMQGLLACTPTYMGYDRFAEEAVKHADALFAALKGKTTAGGGSQ